MRLSIASALRAVICALTVSLLGVGATGCAFGDKEAPSEEMAVEGEDMGAEEAAPKKDKKKKDKKKDKKHKKKK